MGNQFDKDIENMNCGSNVCNEANLEASSIVYEQPRQKPTPKYFSTTPPFVENDIH